MVLKLSFCTHVLRFLVISFKSINYFEHFDSQSIVHHFNKMISLNFRTTDYVGIENGSW